jgi:pimeloyl-ACP methyl ester carboxylesterase
VGPARRQVAVVSAGPIDVRRHGSRGPVVALLHGGPGAPGEMASLADDLADAFTVLEPWQRHSGGEPLTVACHVVDLAAVLPEGAAVVGWSWGAMLALSFAAAHPGRRRAESVRAAMQQAGSEDERNRLLGELGRLLAAAQACDPLPEHAGEPAWIDARGHAETWADALRLQAVGVEPASFSAITCPVLMLHGEDDPHPGRATFQTLRRHLPQIRYRGFPRCGHRPWAERRARSAFLAELREWLA